MKPLILSIVLLFYTIQLYAGTEVCTTSCTDDFNSDLEQWSASYRATDTSGGSYLAVNRDVTSTKTFSFGAANANSPVTISFSLYAGE